jgi:FAD:protein FMN transferase
VRIRLAASLVCGSSSKVFGADGFSRLPVRPEKPNIMQQKSSETSPNRHNFLAMASPCEVQIEGLSAPEFAKIVMLAEAEARRIETKFSRYRDDSVLSKINRSNAKAIAIDTETSALLSYAAQCHALSAGLFDVTSGVLRRMWKFDGSDRVPTGEAVAKILPLVGWDKVTLGDGMITLPAGMEIDFGGLGKEYAVDRALLAIAVATDAPALVNFGGDLRVTGPRLDGQPWRIAIEAADEWANAAAMVEISGGAITTSGDAKRFQMKNGIRYSHILNPRTGWPVVNPPRSVTVAAASCMEAGILSTLAMLHGQDAETFLNAEKCVAWVSR